jgi:hypothetical protein
MRIGVVVSNKLASLYELQTVYGSEDLFDFIEIITVNNYNQEISMKGKK